MTTCSNPPILSLYIFLVIFFLLITLLPSSSIYPFPGVCSHHKGTDSPQFSWLLLCPPFLPWLDSTLAAGPLTTTDANVKMSIFF